MDKQHYFALLLISGAIGDYSLKSRRKKELGPGWQEAIEEWEDSTQKLNEKGEYYYKDGGSVNRDYRKLLYSQHNPKVGLYNLLLKRLKNNEIDQKDGFTKEEIIEASREIISEWMNPSSHPERKS